MPETHDSEPFVFIRGPLIVSLESLFWHVQRYPKRRVAPQRPPLTETASPRELEQPYRRGHARVFRFPLTRRALVLGWWEPAGENILAEEESQHLLEAIEGAHIPGITAYDIAEWARASDVAVWWRRLATWWRQWLSRPLYRDQAAPAGASRAVADDWEMDGWAADIGWSVSPWTPEQDDAVIDMEAARTKPKLA